MDSIWLFFKSFNQSDQTVLDYEKLVSKFKGNESLMRNNYMEIIMGGIRAALVPLTVRHGFVKKKKTQRNLLQYNKSRTLENPWSRLRGPAVTQPHMFHRLKSEDLNARGYIFVVLFIVYPLVGMTLRV